MTQPLLAAARVEVVLDGATLLPQTSLTLGAGDRVAVVGPNGAGKTTLLRVLAGRLRPSAGEARLLGRKIDERGAATRREIAALIEPPALYPDLTVEEHLALINAAWSGPGAAACAEEALERFGLGPLRDRFPGELSSGQNQLVSLAVTFARPASILLLDEPEQRLDPQRRELVAEAIRRASAGGTAVVFSSHDARLVESTAERAVRVGA